MRIVSGGQTGADRAGLDFAINRGIPYGGWCPKGRKAEDGPIDTRYQLQESPSAGYLQRTKWNVRDSDGTVVFTLSKKVTGGSLRTLEFAQDLQKPCVHICCQNGNAAAEFARFISANNIEVLNVAGSRESKEPGLHAEVIRVLGAAFPVSPAQPPVFTLIPGQWVAMNRQGRGHGPVKIRNVTTSSGILYVDLYDAFYPEGVREKCYSIRSVVRDRSHVEGQSEFYVSFEALTRDWLAANFDANDVSRLLEARDPAAALEQFHFGHL